ncbi:putative RNA-binding protein NOB1 [Monocercomonoides exilis]|uniref:putative RNA-binding protein NOB1 n=1 Tax=Monocercomonoides exilis TaxID=2049356 RepID=UPI00355A37C3|nr:putative RNA-binding protein NOB1 [Monocercomonoides exilis]|eukprot:MONOS_8070.1-p1 / transcript=MONOS_8070.1 / gene=MONOS_8070 / organism=Monocercomonoides_exilis_PA203 / gene_product=unspecified product / transcript_product=unspecified product / location=Mono_scaffold00294:40250-42209(-) / protein_length=569 / sequence_SO=supercontig / SO=protein_coding / is_pseudo=false
MQKYVLDTAAFIEYFQPNFLTTQLFTTSGVIAEIRDVTARQKYEEWKSHITIQNPTKASIKAVEKFAKMTGEVTFLSKVDIGVAALAYDLETSENGMKNIKQVPPSINFVQIERRSAVQESESESEEEEEKEIKKKTVDPDIADGWKVAGGKKGKSKKSNNKSKKKDKKDEKQALDQEKKPQPAEPEIEDDEDDWITAENLHLYGSGSMFSHAIVKELEPMKVIDKKITEEEAKNENEKFKKLEEEADAHEKCSKDCEKAEEQSTSSSLVTTTSSSSGPLSSSTSSSEEAPSSSSSSSSSPSSSSSSSTNTRQPLIPLIPPPVAPSSSTHPSSAITARSNVFLITADFAVQNVALQMGLSLMALQGKAITSVRRYLLHCTACNTLVKDITRLFCPECGSYPLRKVGYVVVGADGAQKTKTDREKEEGKEEQKEGDEKSSSSSSSSSTSSSSSSSSSEPRVIVFMRPSQRRSFKGLQYDIPIPKGGRKGRPLVEREDVYQDRVKKTRRRIGNRPTGNVTKDGYVTRMDDEDVDPLGRVSGKQERVVIGFGRRNPNAPKHIHPSKKRHGKR